MSSTEGSRFLDDANFIIVGEGEFELMYLGNIEEDKNPGMAYMDDTNTLANEEYGHMITAK